MMTHYILTAASSRLRPAPALLQALFGLAALWRSRAALRDLPTERLEDIGLTAKEADREAAKAPWDVPAHWLR